MAEAKKEKEVVLLYHVKSGEIEQTIDLTQEQLEVEFRGFRSALEELDRKGFEFSETRCPEVASSRGGSTWTRKMSHRRSWKSSTILSATTTTLSEPRGGNS